MEYEKEMKRRLEVGDFARNNGRILRTVNILRGKWINLATVQEALERDMNVGDFENSIIYLEKSGYVEVRDTTSKTIIEVGTASYSHAEVTLTKEGMDVALYFKKDEAVIV